LENKEVGMSEKDSNQIRSFNGHWVLSCLGGKPRGVDHLLFFAKARKNFQRALDLHAKDHSDYNFTCVVMFSRIFVDAADTLLKRRKGEDKSIDRATWKHIKDITKEYRVKFRGVADRCQHGPWSESDIEKGVKDLDQLIVAQHEHSEAIRWITDLAQLLDPVARANDLFSKLAEFPDSDVEESAPLHLMVPCSTMKKLRNRSKSIRKPVPEVAINLIEQGLKD